MNQTQRAYSVPPSGLRLGAALAVAAAMAVGMAPAPPGAHAQPLGLTTKRFGLTSFEAVQIEGNMTVEITPSHSISATAEGSRDAIETLSMEVNNRRLVIRQRTEGPYGAPRMGQGPIRIRLTAQNLNAITLAGSGVVRADGLRGPTVRFALDGAGSLSATVPAGTEIFARAIGSGSIILSGRGQRLTASTNGSGGIDASALTVRNLDVQAVGSGASRFAATGTARISAMGTTSITVTGNPQCTVQNSGAGSIDCGPNIRDRLPQDRSR